MEAVAQNPRARMRLSKLTAAQAIQEWELLSRLLSLADERSMGRYTVDDIREEVRVGDTIILVAWVPGEGRLYAAFACAVELYPRKKVFNVMSAGGIEMQSWLHLYPALKEFARELGCDQIEVSGRPGWGRVLRQFLKERGRIYAEDL